MNALRIVVAVLLVAGSAGSTVARAKDYTSLYSAAELSRASDVYLRNLPLVWKEDLVQRLNSPDRQRAAGIDMRFPLIGMNRSPLDYYADPGAAVITIPILSVKFYDDISIAAAWLDRNGCNLGAVSDYAGMLAYGTFGASGYPAPLAALPVPANALDDPVVDDIAQKSLKSAIYFLMAHELAHVLHGHQSYATLSVADAQQQEMESDAYAMELMRRIAVPPLGMVLFFAIASRFEPAPGDFEDLADYQSYVRNQSTHPLTSARLGTLANVLEQNAASFSSLQTDPLASEAAMAAAAADIRLIGETLDNPEIREYQRTRSLNLSPEDLRNACN